MTDNNLFGGFCTILPMELVSFTGVCDMNNSVLNWSTAAEANNKLFTVQRSDDGKSWQVIRTIDGSGNSSTLHTYSVTDNLPGKSVSYYRLMLTAFGGENTYSTVITVGNCGVPPTGDFTVYPNPSSGTFSLLFTGDRTRISSIGIFNTLGEQVYASTGFQSAFNLSNKPSGEYYVQIHLPSKTVNMEVIVVK